MAHVAVMRVGARALRPCETIFVQRSAGAQFSWVTASDNARYGRRGAMWNDLAALVPPLTVAAVFCAGVFWVVRREMGGKRRREDTREKVGPDSKPGQ